MSTPEIADAYDPTSPAFRADPFPTYARMRREAPIHTIEEDGPMVWNRGRAWLIFRYAESVEMLRDTKHFVKDFRLAFSPEELGEQPPAPDFFNVIADSLIVKENPDHLRLRRLVNQAFSASRVAARRDAIIQAAEELLDQVQEQGQMDLIGEFSYHLPVTVITDMLGLPRADVPKLRGWAVDSLVTDPAELPAVSERMDERFDYLRQEFAVRRRQPTDDLITALLMAESEGERLREHEILAMVGLLVGAGFETTMNLIANAILNLLRRPDQLAQLQENPALVNTAIDEFLRFEGPLYTATPRWAAKDIDFHGHQIRRGDRVLPILLSANRDEEKFPDAEHLDLCRLPNAHLGFGIGSHFCLGGPLARLEAQIAIPTLLRRLPDLELAVAETELRWIDSPLFHGLERLPVRWRTSS